MTTRLPDPTVEPLIDISRCAGILAVSERQARRLADSGVIPTVRIGQRRRKVPCRTFLAKFDLLED